MAYLGTQVAAEAVDIEVRDGLAILCGGFGARINRFISAQDFEHVGSAGERCQHAAIGPDTFWIAHHGDTWVTTPLLAAFRLEDDQPVELGRISDPDILFEGLHYRDKLLYAATHAGGVRIYDVSGDGVPVFVDVVDGFVNAQKIASEGETLYVSDGAGGVKVLSLADPLAPTHVTTIDTVGLARDLDVRGGRLVVALGGDGVASYDVTDPASPVLHGTIDPRGSAQGVALTEDTIAIAAWSHVAVYDRETLQLLGTQRVRLTPQFEQDLGVAVEGNLVHVAEWEGHHVIRYQPGLVAPDLWVEDELLAFDPENPRDKAVVIRNRGYLDLDIDDIDAQGDAFDSNLYYVRVPPREATAIEVSFTPPADGTEDLALHSNDPDGQQTPHRVPLSALPTDKIGIGDKLTEEFAFLSPTGTLEGLEGHVTVIAYFALF